MLDHSPRALASLAGLVFVGLSAGPALAQNLTQAYDLALRHDPDHAEALANRDAAAANGDLARALWLPKAQLQASSSYSRVTLHPDTTPAGLSNDGSGGAVLVGIEQPLIDGEARAQSRQLRAGVQAGLAVYDARRQKLALDVAQAYFDLLKAQDLVASVLAQQALTQREQQAAQARFDAGRAKITDVYEARARADALTAQLVDARAQQDLAQSRLAEFTGLDDFAPLRPRTDLAAAAPSEALSLWQARAEDNAPSIAARRAQLAASQAKADQYRWSSQIKISATATAGELWRGGSDSALLGVALPDRAEGFTAGVRLKAPLYTGGSLTAQRSQAQAQARGADAQLAAAKRDLRLDVEKAWRAQRSGADQILALRAALASAQLQEQAAVTGREVGVRTQTDVLASQAQSFETDRRLRSALYDYEYSRLALSVAAGSLDDKTLAQADQDLTEPASR
ncbi:TolC family protein [Caulobacter segnis]|nr:TolC family protein [Caulobacter segnis]